MWNKHLRVVLEIDGKGQFQSFRFTLLNCSLASVATMRKAVCTRIVALFARFKRFCFQRPRHAPPSGQLLPNPRKWATSSTSRSAIVTKSATGIASGTGNGIFGTVKARSGYDMWVLHSLLVSSITHSLSLLAV